MYAWRRNPVKIYYRYYGKLVMQGNVSTGCWHSDSLSEDCYTQSSLIQNGWHMCKQHVPGHSPPTRPSKGLGTRLLQACDLCTGIISWYTLRMQVCDPSTSTSRWIFMVHSWKITEAITRPPFTEQSLIPLLNIAYWSQHNFRTSDSRSWQLGLCGSPLQ